MQIRLMIFLQAIHRAIYIQYHEPFRTWAQKMAGASNQPTDSRHGRRATIRLLLPVVPTTRTTRTMNHANSVFRTSYEVLMTLMLDCMKVDEMLVRRSRYRESLTEIRHRKSAEQEHRNCPDDYHH
jgi:hypothetical protein